MKDQFDRKMDGKKDEESSGHRKEGRKELRSIREFHRTYSSIGRRTEHNNLLYSSHGKFAREVNRGDENHLSDMAWDLYKGRQAKKTRRKGNNPPTGATDSGKGPKPEEEAHSVSYRLDTGGSAARLVRPIPALVVSPVREDESTDRVEAVRVEAPAVQVTGSCRRHGVADLNAALFHSRPTGKEDGWRRAKNKLSAYGPLEDRAVGKEDSEGREEGGSEDEEEQGRDKEGDEEQTKELSCLPKLSFARRLSNLVSTAAQSQQFFEGLGKMRERVAEENKDKEPIPVFNKRLFTSHGTVVITAEARRLMARNGRTRPGQDFPLFTKSELHTMRCVVDGLRLIHRGQDHVKDALSHVITMESYSPYQYIVKRPHEAQLSCYYILHGAVQVTYDMDITETRSVFQPDIIYNHGTGEFLGLVSPDGLSDDLSPPATVYTTEPSEFLRIDRTKFHAVVKKIADLQELEKLTFLNKPSNVIASLPPDALEKVISHVHKMEYPPNKTILGQGDTSGHLYFILSGRCQLSRDVFIPEIDRDVQFYLDAREQDDFFAEECILTEDGGSLCHVTTTSHTTCYLMHREALRVVNKEMLLHVLESRRHYFPPDSELRDLGYRKSLWDGYKHQQVRQSLQERGCLYILSREEPEKVRSRPPSAEFQRKENLLRFLAKGANYTPVSKRVRSATVARTSSSVVTGSSSRVPLRPCTALGNCHQPINQKNARRPSKHPPTLVTETGPIEGDQVQDVANEGKEKYDDLTDKDDDVMTASDDALGSTPVTTSFVRMLEKNLPKGVLQKIVGKSVGDVDPRLLGRAMEENPELGRQLRLAWEMHQQEKQEGFTKTTVLVTMKTDDIVRKAKALAEKQTFTGVDSGEEENADQRCTSSLQEENTSARTSIAGDKLRAAYLLRKIKALQRKRAQARADLVYRSAKPGQVPPTAERLETDKSRKKIEAGFYLDEIQSKFQGLDPQDASKKVSAMGYQVLFVSRLRRRTRSMCEIRETSNKAQHADLIDSTDTDHGLTPRVPMDQETCAAYRRRSDVTPRSAGPRSVRKDAPITLSPGHPSSEHDGEVTSCHSVQRRLSRDTTQLSKNMSRKKNLPHPKLQVNR